MTPMGTGTEICTENVNLRVSDRPADWHRPAHGDFPERLHKTQQPTTVSVGPYSLISRISGTCADQSPSFSERQCLSAYNQRPSAMSKLVRSSS